ERGTVVIKRPGRMRWLYTAPERKEFVSDGVTIYAYFPADKQVMVSPAPTGADTTPALFLTGQANLVRDFTAAALDIPGAAAGLLGLKLVAKQPDPDFEWLAVGVDPVNYQIRHLVALDRQGGRSTFVFTDLKENQRPPDTLFAFRIPKGVDVITNAR
ncbi:MAG TPA: outer membrane lipoprotein carrier protein LolA, partial [Vicinamibacterales bacterium]|nr:outer membrane lipoprotein carrier protein LolA [Vicinamibacterales bacterium]